MTLDLLIPFGILLCLVIYFIYTRSQFEQKTHSLYEEKFKQWKKHTPTTINMQECKELVGLVFKENGTIKIELLKQEVKRKLLQGKFEIKE
ncbi:MAG: hypothetical protein WC141_00415 [Arcobacteraceae bacterium]